MPNEINIPKYNELEKILYKQLGKKAFLFIAPQSSDPEFTKHLSKVTTTLKKGWNNSKKQLYIQDYLTLLRFSKYVPIPSTLEAERTNLNKLTFDFLYTQHILQQIRWDQALPEMAEYAIEFFLPELTEAEKVELRITNQREQELQVTLSVDLPYALVKDKRGEFDLKATQEREDTYHLIASKLAGISPLETISGYLFNELFDFPEWAFFAANHQSSIKEISRILVQVIFDWLQVFAYEQLDQGILPDQAKSNAFSYLLSQINTGKLEELIVFRTDYETPLDLYVLQILSELQSAKPYLKQQLLKDFYTHIFKSLDKIIKQKRFITGELYNVSLRTASPSEFDTSGGEYVVEVNPISASGQVLDQIKELYKIKYSRESENQLIIVALNGLSPEAYIL